jgi:hypothetical protein
MSLSEIIKEINNSTIPLHKSPLLDFIIRHVINNPKTHIESPELKIALINKFPEKCADDEDTKDLIYDEFNELYRQGIVDKYAIYWLYLREDIIILIYDCIKINREPLWEGSF